MKKIFSLAVALGLTMSFSFFSPSFSIAKAETVKAGTVNTYSLTVRKGPGVNYSAIDYIRKGTTVTIVNEYTGDWSKISYSGKTGYVYDKYLNITTKTVTPSTTTTNVSKVGTVTAYRLTVRTGPSANYSAKDYLRNGTKVTITKMYSNGWAYVSYGGGNGYVSGKYLKITTVTSAPAPIAKKVVSTYDGFLNVRKGPSVNYAIIGQLHNGEEVSIYKTGSWSYVSNGKITGYVNSSYLKDVAPAPTPTPTVPQTLSGKVITLDPGHGGNYEGAQGIVREEMVNLQIALKVRDKLQALGAKVFMTRTSDTNCLARTGVSYYGDLQCRSDVANNSHSNIFVSIHANSGTSLAHGTETWYYNSNRGDSKLAQSIYNQLSSTTGLYGRGVKQESWYVISHTYSSIPSTLIETGFVTNSGDVSIIGSSTGQDKVAQAVTNGIVNFFK
jgi:N-acetylmuramoyl-L-alanine amidase